ncbi:MAG: uroporphyrinogen-III synthase [Lysobacteraceae bacterium]|nr:MAG: uroporphyrinogen-III synthase [Xanthomonadaceae bacterium]
MLPSASDANATLVVSLRPSGDHAAMRRAAGACGLRVAALSPWKIMVSDTAPTRAALRAACGAQIVIVTSPAAARAAARLTPLRPRRGQSWCAIGHGTAQALRRAGIARVEVPDRMDSEGLLALPGLREVRGTSVGLLTAPGGRDQIAPALRRRGAELLRADVYERVPLRLSTTMIARLRASPDPWLLPVSSGEALQRVLAQAPPDLARRLRDARVLAASARIAEIARACGCRDVRIAPGPAPRQLLAAAC